MSSQFYYSNYFPLVKRELNKKKYKITNFKIIWYDKKNEIIKGIKKRQNYKVKYLTDVFYHFFSIFNLLTKPKKIIFTRIKKENGKYNFKINDINIILDVSRDNKKRYRIIELNDKNNNSVKINFNRYFNFKMNNKKIFKFNRLDKCLSKQLYFFLNYRKTYKLNHSLVENNKNLFSIINKTNLIE